MTRRVPVALSIAGSDSGGGAGVQADLNTFGAVGVFATTAITAVTVQNTRGVSGFQALDPSTVAAQVRAVVDDIGVDAAVLPSKRPGEGGDRWARMGAEMFQKLIASAGENPCDRVPGFEG